jgi:hypothetical protein
MSVEMNLRGITLTFNMSSLTPSMPRLREGPSGFARGDQPVYCLSKNEDGTFSTDPFYQPVDARFVTPILRFTLRPYTLWLQRIDAYDDNLKNLLDWMERVNTALFMQFDKYYDG